MLSHVEQVKGPNRLFDKHSDTRCKVARSNQREFYEEHDGIH